MHNHNRKSQLTDDRAKAIAAATFMDMRSNGTANMAGSRARTQPSAWDKSRNPRIQRKRKAWLND